MGLVHFILGACKSIHRIRVRGRDESADLRDGDVQTAAAVEALPPRSDAPPAPVPHGALRGADEVAELLEGEEAVVRPIVGDLDGSHVYAFRGLSALVL